MKLRYAASASVAVALSMSACALGSSTTSNAGPINVGVIGALSGQFATFGTADLDAAQTAATIVNKNGGVMGRHITIVPADDGWDPVDAVPAARKLVATGNINAVFGPASLDWKGVLPIFEQARVVSFNIVGDPSIDNLTDTYTYSLVPSDALDGTAMAAYANSKGYSHVALVFDQTLGAQVLVPSATAAATKLGMTIVASPVIPTSALSYESEVLQIIQAKPDAVLMQIQPSQLGQFMRDWTKFGAGNLPVIVSSSTDGWGTTVPTSVLAHSVAVQAGKAGSAAGTALYTSTFTSIYGQAPTVASAKRGYDAVTIAALAMISAGSTDPTVFVKSITAIEGEGNQACDSFAACAQLLKQGKKIDYQPIANALVWNEHHRTASDFEVVTLPPGASAVGENVATISATQIAAAS